MQMRKHLFYFRPGEEARMLARCQFGINVEGGCGATFTYPMKGMPWRNNPMKSYEFHITDETKELLFKEVHRLLAEHPTECLAYDQLWSDSSEKANGITRDRLTGTLCHTIAIFPETGDPIVQYDIRENSKALVTSQLYLIISELIAPHEKL
jgi:hypothetical protein